MARKTDSTSPRRRESPSSGAPWTDFELRSTVDAYMYSLRLQAEGITFPLKLLSDVLLEGPLKHRNAASLRYRMRNISHVMEARRWPTVVGYSPAERVGSGVRERIENILDEYGESEAPLFPAQAETPNKNVDASFAVVDLLDAAKSKASELKVSLENLNSQHAGLGHNNPPDPISDEAVRPSDIQDAVELVSQLEVDLESSHLDKTVIERRRNELLGFGLKIVGWLGGRFTVFIDASLRALAVGMVASLFAALSGLIDFAGLLTRLIG